MSLDEFLEFSDEEVLSASPSDAESENLEEDDEEEVENLRAKALSGRYERKRATDTDTESSRAPSDDDDLNGWGTSKKDYYNADLIETEADALEEEAEARRLQQKYLQRMTEADFGFNENDGLEAGRESKDENEHVRAHDGVVIEVLPQLEITDAMGPDERSDIFEARYPEFEPLAKEFLDLQARYEDLSVAATAATAAQNNGPANGSEVQERLPVAVIKHSSLGAYLAALCMYFALLTSTTANGDGKAVAMPPAELREHPIMDSLVQCRELWNRSRSLEIPEPVAFSDHSTAILERPQSDQEFVSNSVEALPLTLKTRKRKSRAERVAALAQKEADARRLKRLRETEASLASLSELTKVASKPTKVVTPMDDDESDFGDPTYLAAHEAAQKAARKKSLQFYTSQIASKIQKRGTAGRDAGGDADIPHKERLRDRQERLNAQAEKRGKRSKATQQEALGGESDEGDAEAARAVRNGEEEDYYDLVASRSLAKKAAKAKAAAEQAAVANSLVRVPDDELDGEDSKRAISYAIEKNKGLHAKRKKEVRNPRVKKRVCISQVFLVFFFSYFHLSAMSR